MRISADPRQPARSVAHRVRTHLVQRESEVAEQAIVSSEVVDGTVRVTRLMRDIPPVPAFLKYGGYNNNINRWQVGRYSTPSFIYIVNGSTPADQSLGGIDTTSSNGRFGWEVYHAVTPETDQTAISSGESRWSTPSPRTRYPCIF